jgi:hypothetical protein
MAKKIEKKAAPKKENSRTTMSITKAEMQKFKAWMQKKHIKRVEMGFKALMSGAK